MYKQKVNVVDPTTGKRKIGILNEKTGMIKLGFGLFRNYSKTYLENCGKIIEFDKYENGKKITNEN